MGKIFCIIGKSASGKDTIYKRLLNELPLSAITLSTTRPMREGEQEGREYFFITEEKRQQLHRENQIIEERVFSTIYGDWYYLTTTIAVNLEEENYITLNTLEGYRGLVNFYGKESVIPIYVYADLNERIDRAFKREETATSVNINKYKEITRRFIRDEEDFKEERLLDAEIYEERRFKNDQLEECIKQIKEKINSEIASQEKKKEQGR